MGWVLAFSRPFPAMRRAFQQARNQIPVFVAGLTANHDDIRIVVGREVECVPSSQEFPSRARTVDEITLRAQGNFLALGSRSKWQDLHSVQLSGKARFARFSPD